ncbi:glyoxylase-like metal-dependent hydrolase (beta-lactamase superfamily II) [Micromonospora kangleipakensis]|jgi:glyoxylase-like metal-dependent hydrolase (beta-lactamase superfamily II)|uniref:Glyoxylase-like metal-dependent hydrolase (Beta-lactamase superfamily II) n=1 Tax=Micromonospora kangleipakensis TaxID=1077942 RepID=A0A4Q8B570_9ACTN|nr:MBL fold metallo-hydrolase [Micromonospora kangleipakensis]RZU72145.1 glyoxylase-like metal-dependent hydrolase (beta-lactamase superfamily II) [Micromonospora kangleipakensis]
MGGHVTGAAGALADELPGWVTLLRAPNPGPMTLDGTNTWVLRAAPGEPAVVVDPGPADEDHLARIVAHGPVGLVLITHGHPDHTEASARLHELLGGAHVLAADPAHTIGGEPLTAPGGHLGGFGVAIHLLPTPGHTADSVCFLVEHEDERVVLTGDTILGRGTTVVAHPDGHLGDYLASLELLSTYRGIPALPGHGPALADCGAAAEFYLAHRRARLDQVRAAVDAGATTAPEVVERVYADVDRSLWWAAEWSVRAQLEYLGVEPRESGAGGAELKQP